MKMKIDMYTTTCQRYVMVCI